MFASTPGAATDCSVSVALEHVVFMLDRSAIPLTRKCSKFSEWSVSGYVRNALGFQFASRQTSEVAHGSCRTCEIPALPAW